MFADYMKERQGADCLKVEDAGFVFYRVQGNELYIVDMYIEPASRGSELLFSFIKNLEHVAKEHSCKFLSGNIYLSDPGCNRTLNAAFKVGFKLANANNNILLIIKEL